MAWFLLLWGCFVANYEPARHYASIPQQAFVIGKPRRSGEWKHPPLIKVCKDLNISQTRVQIAVAYWRNSGYEFHDVIYDYDSPECYGDYYGTDIIITFADQTLQDNHMAATRTTINTTTGYILKAKILMRDQNVNKFRILEHEMGHALGWKHYPQYMHIMHPDWELGGYSNAGVRNPD